MHHVGCMTVLNLTWFRAQSSPIKASGSEEPLARRGEDNTW